MSLTLPATAAQKPVVDLAALPEAAMWAEWERVGREHRPELWAAYWRLRDWSFQCGPEHEGGRDRVFFRYTGDRP